MHTAFSHKYDFGTVVYDERGITISPSLSRVQLLVSWSDIDFLSLTPAVEKKNGLWKTYNGIDLMPANALETLNYLNIDIALHNRHELKTPKLSLFGSMKFWMVFPTIQAIYDADDKPSPKVGCLKYKIRKNSLNAPLSQLLDFIAAQSRFGLLCVFD